MDNIIFIGWQNIWITKSNRLLWKKNCQFGKFTETLIVIWLVICLHLPFWQFFILLVTYCLFWLVFILAFCIVFLQLFMLLFSFILLRGVILSNSYCLINFSILNINASFGNNFIDWLLSSYIWLIGKNLFILFLFVLFFIIPSFAFVSEINAKNKSLLVTYIKTKGNVFRICLVVFIAFFLLLLIMFLMSYLNIILAAFLRSVVFVYISLLYFKMYDFFYANTLKVKWAKFKKFITLMEE